MSPAARLKHARHALAGLLLPATWLALSGAARADEAAAPETTTTTEAPATTTTVPPSTTTTVPLPKKAQKQLKQAAAAQALFDSLGFDDPASDQQAASAEPTDPGPIVGTLETSPGGPAPAAISVGDAVAAALDRAGRSTGSTAAGDAPTGASATDTAPVSPVTGLPTGDGSGSGAPLPAAGGFSFTAAPAPTPSGGGTDLVSGATAVPVDPATIASTGGAPAIVQSLGAGSTGQGENPERGPPGAAITTGDATATGNHSVTTIDQTLMIAVTDKGTVSLTTAENPDTGASWMSATLPAGLLGAHATELSAMGTGFVSGTGTGTATITTGDALAVGNWSDTTINQKTMVAVTADGQDLVVDQPASVANVGTASATTGGNTALGTTNGGGGSAVITTGNATAYGNRSTTVINQSTMIAVTGSNSHVWVTQSATVDNIGTATATTGDNTATGTTGEGDGTAVIRTGDATAVGNQSSTTINQSGIAAVTGNGSTADIDQQADVNNVGTATATTGGNAAVATSGGSIGSVLITTGNADATGNTAQTTITQKGIRVSTGRFAGTSITQDAGVVNAGTAVAASGINTAVGAG